MEFPRISVPGEGALHARLVTSMGEIIVRLEERRTPKTVANFFGLATGATAWTDPKTGELKTQPLFADMRFHRVLPDVLVQCGDPWARYPDSRFEWGSGNPGYHFDDEFQRDLLHDDAGVLSMANSGPNRNGSQWFITVDKTPHLDNKHTVFGKVIHGQEVVVSIARLPATVLHRPDADILLQRVEFMRG